MGMGMELEWELELELELELEWGLELELEWEWGWGWGWGFILILLERRNFTPVRPQLTLGSGVMSKALGIKIAHTGTDICRPDSPTAEHQLLNKQILAICRF